jgi:mannose-6-phosphate isomerase-like protein (cupin superfamily)
MKNIRIVRTDINVSKILKQLSKHPEDWNFQKKLPETKVLDPHVYISQAAVLQLVIGTISHEDEYVFDSEGCMPSPAYYRHTEAVAFLKRHFKNFKRAGFLALPPGGVTGKHVDFGKYYLTKDRYHLSIQGTYEYTVEDESIIVKPGTLFWFDNKKEHSAKNIGDNDRIVLVFDVPHSKSNP